MCCASNANCHWRCLANVAKQENLIWIKIKLIAEYWNQWPNEYAARSAAHGIIYIWKYSSNCNPQAIDAERFTNKFTIITINSVFRFILAALTCSRLVCSFFIQFVRSLVLCIICSCHAGSLVHWFSIAVVRSEQRKKRITQNAHENLIKNVILIAVTRFSLAFSFNFFFLINWPFLSFLIPSSQLHLHNYCHCSISLLRLNHGKIRTSMEWVSEVEKEGYVHTKTILATLNQCNANEWKTRKIKTIKLLAF